MLAAYKIHNLWVFYLHYAPNTDTINIIALLLTLSCWTGLLLIETHSGLPHIKSKEREAAAALGVC